jgi:transcriptional regulator with XRE-family HTH domain
MDSPQFREKVGKRIKKFREKAKLTQEQVAQKAGLNTNYFAVIERGEVNTGTPNLLKISKALGIEITELIK